MTLPCMKEIPSPSCSSSAADNILHQEGAYPHRGEMSSVVSFSKPQPCIEKGLLQKVGRLLTLIVIPAFDPDLG